MIKSAMFVTLLAACGGSSNPPPQYAQPQPAPAPTPAPTPAPVDQVAAPAPVPVQPPAPVLPFDPEKDMPAESVATNATLTLETEANVKIDARSDIYSSGKAAADKARGGMLPSALTLAPGGGSIELTGVVGRVGCVPGSSEIADGGSCAGGNTTLTAAGSISGITHHQRTLFLVGVFLGAKPGKAPAGLDFSDGKVGTTFAKLEPKLGQVFFIGDGLTGTESGDRQKFIIPKGATTLYLGYADGFSFQGKPGYYNDNKGGLSVSLIEQKP